MRISFKTLGCRLNQHETDSLVSQFDQEGHKIVDFKEEADVTIINTCTVTGQSDHKSRNIIQQAIKANPKAKIVVTGCMAEQYKKQLEQIKGVDLVVSNAAKSDIVRKVNSFYDNSPIEADKLSVFNYEPVNKSLHTRAAIKIQDGCDNYCTFCIIPQVRGRAVSRPVDDIISSIKQTLANGFKEIVITGVNIGRYYYEGVRFVELMKNILEISGDFRVRISSLEPDGFGDELIDLFENPKLTPHLHLCIQSGSDPILLKMRRMYSIDQYYDLVNKIKKRFPNFNITTDIIVGFPSETDFHFNQTVKTVNELQFSHVHTFKYSIRNGTSAARMKSQVDEKIKNARSETIRKISAKNKEHYYTKFIGCMETVLVEKHLGNNWYLGYGEHYIPIIFKHTKNLKNEFVKVKITKLNIDRNYRLEGIVQTARKVESRKGINKTIAFS